VPDNLTSGAKDLGSVGDIGILDNNQLAHWSRKIMSRQLENYGINILQLHAEWLRANGYKREASSCKQQIRMILINKKKKEKRQAASFKLDTSCRI